MDLENTKNSIVTENQPHEEIKVNGTQTNTEIVTENAEITMKKQELQKGEKLMEKLSEDPVKQKKILKDWTRKDVKFSYDLQRKLATIPRKVLNRRYKKLQELIEGDSDYFSEESVRDREPILYFLYVGRYLREGDDNANKKLSEVLMDQMLIEDWKARVQKELKESGFINDIDFDENIDITKEELDDNIDEMMRLLHDRFVAGLDKHFDYASIDNDETLDDEVLIRQDEEDKYFDDEEAETDLGENLKSEYTGIQDY